MSAAPTVGLAKPCAAQAPAGYRCWGIKAAMGTVLDPRGQGVADANARAASPNVYGAVGG
jgi:hypothetical protein